MLTSFWCGEVGGDCNWRLYIARLYLLLVLIGPLRLAVMHAVPVSVRGALFGSAACTSHAGLSECAACYSTHCTQSCCHCKSCPTSGDTAAISLMMQDKVVHAPSRILLKRAHRKRCPSNSIITLCSSSNQSVTGGTDACVGYAVLITATVSVRVFEQFLSWLVTVART